MGESHECRLINLLGTILRLDLAVGWGVVAVAGAGVVEEAESTAIGVDAGGSKRPTAAATEAAGDSSTTITNHRSTLVTVSQAESHMRSLYGTYTTLPSKALVQEDTYWRETYPSLHVILPDIHAWCVQRYTALRHVTMRVTRRLRLDWDWVTRHAAARGRGGGDTFPLPLPHHAHAPPLFSSATVKCSTSPDVNVLSFALGEMSSQVKRTDCFSLKISSVKVTSVIVVPKTNWLNMKV